jgi:hypothetical protein
MTKCHKATSDSLYPLKVLDRAHFRDGHYFFEVVFDAALENDEPKQHTPWDPEYVFLRVELDAIPLELFES